MVTELIIDQLKMIKIEKYHSHANLMAIAAGDGFFDFTAEMAAVGQAGEFILIGDLLQTSVAIFHALRPDLNQLQ